MKLLLCLLAIGLVTGCGKPELILKSSAILHQDANKKIILSTYYPSREIIALPIWVVTASSQNKTEELFTVLRVFQEPEPAPPIYLDGIITDQAGSYVYSLSEGQFTTNKYPDAVYLGGYKPSN